MHWSRFAKVTDRWRRLSEEYVRNVNRWVAQGEELGSNRVGAYPEDARDEALAREVIDIVRAANAEGCWEVLRERLPPAHGPFIPVLEKQAIGMDGVVWTDRTHVVARVGTPWVFVGVYRFGLDGSVAEVPDVLLVARSPSGRLFARATEQSVSITDG